MIRNLVKMAYDDIIRPRTPRKIVAHNGVAVRSGRLLDITDEKPEYEASLIAAMRERIEPGDDVVVVGGGKGVSTVVAQRQTRTKGSVTVFEGAAAQVDQLRETLSLNGTTDSVTVNHVIVGIGEQLWDDAAGAERVEPDDLPECDVLVLDCEGAEVGILQEADLPRTVIVETHGIFDAPTDETRDLLEKQHMTVEADRTEIAEEDVHVLTAVKQ